MIALFVGAIALAAALVVAGVIYALTTFLGRLQGIQDEREDDL